MLRTKLYDESIDTVLKAVPVSRKVNRKYQRENKECYTLLPVIGKVIVIDQIKTKSS